MPMITVLSDIGRKRLCSVPRLRDVAGLGAGGEAGRFHHLDRRTSVAGVGRLLCSNRVLVPTAPARVSSSRPSRSGQFIGCCVTSAPRN
eukprot:5365854-Pleurochrysis_carterae.AAC.2